MNAIDNYINAFPESQHEMLQQMRSAIRQACPEATETINYGIPTFKYGGNLVHFAQAKNHIGLYPGPKAISAFKERLQAYKTSKGAIQFPVDEPLPVTLVQDIVDYCVKAATARPSPKKTNQP